MIPLLQWDTLIDSHLLDFPLLERNKRHVHLKSVSYYTYTPPCFPSISFFLFGKTIQRGKEKKMAAKIFESKGEENRVPTGGSREGQQDALGGLVRDEAWGICWRFRISKGPRHLMRLRIWRN